MLVGAAAKSPDAAQITTCETVSWPRASPEQEASTSSTRELLTPDDIFPGAAGARLSLTGQMPRDEWPASEEISRPRPTKLLLALPEQGGEGGSDSRGCGFFGGLGGVADGAFCFSCSGEVWMGQFIFFGSGCLEWRI